MGFQNYDGGTTAPVYRPGAAAAIRPSIPRPPSTGRDPCTNAIENRSHYVRDVTFAEDASRIRCNPGIFARLRSFATNILRFNNASNVANTRYRIAFGGIDAILRLRVMY